MERTEMTVEDRLLALEQAVADMQRRLGGQTAGVSWLDEITGSFKDEPAFEQVVEYGRAFRWSDRPSPDGDEQP